MDEFGMSGDLYFLRKKVVEQNPASPFLYLLNYVENVDLIDAASELST